MAVKWPFALLVCFLCVTVHIAMALPPDHDMPTCENPEPVDPNPPQLPELPLQFEAEIEAKIVEKNYVVRVKEYYDYINNKGAVYITKNGETSSVLYDFDSNEAYHIKGEQCTRQDLRKNSYSILEFTQTSSGAHVRQVNDLYHFGKKYNETFISDNTTARGILVSHWRSCVHHPQTKTTYSLDFYFSHPNISLADGQREVPVRAVVHGHGGIGGNDTKQHHFYNIYDFISFKPGNISDPSVFTTPQGVVCPHNVTNKTFPQISDVFAMAVEVVQPKERVSTFRRIYYNFPGNLTRVDWVLPKERNISSHRLVRKLRDRTGTTVQDFGTGIQYTITPEGDCEFGPIPSKGFNIDHPHGDLSWVTLRHGSTLYKMKDSLFRYQGERFARGILCDVWGSVHVDWPYEGINTTVEMYFTQSPKWLYQGRRPTTPVPVAMWVKQMNHSIEINKRLHHFMDYKKYISKVVDGSVFSIRKCFQFNTQIKHLLFLLPRDDSRHLAALIRRAVARVCRVELLRVDDVFVDKTVGYGKMAVWLTLLDKTPYVEGSVEDPITSISLEDAYTNLRSAVKQGKLVFTVPGGRELRVLKNSLKMTSEAVDPRLAAAKNYSSGDMAAIALAMLVGGVIFGIAIAWVLLKRRMGIPYQVHI